MSPRKQLGPTSVEKALDVLLSFSPEEPELGVSQIARHLGMGVSTVHRLLNLMMRRDFVRQNPVTAKYSLGVRAVHLASTMIARSTLHATSLPRMVSLRDATGETVRLYLMSGRERVCVEEIGSNRGEDMQRDFGHAHPFHIGPAGLVMLAWMPEQDIKLVTSEALRDASFGKEEAARFPEELARVRAQGYAVGRDPFVGSVNSLAVPLRNFTGAVIGSLSVDGSVRRWRARRLQSFIDEVKEEGAAISTQLGYSPYGGGPDPIAGVSRRGRGRRRAS